MTKTRNQENQDSHEEAQEMQQQGGSMDSVSQVLSTEQLNELTSRLTLEITQRILANPEKLLANAKEPDDPRGLEEALKSLEERLAFAAMSESD